MARIRRKRQRPSLAKKHAASPDQNLLTLVAASQKLLNGVGVMSSWEQSTWSLSPALHGLVGRHDRKVTINFNKPPALGAKPLQGDWADVAKALFVSREHIKHKAITSNRTFISAIGHVAEAAHPRTLAQLTPSILDDACRSIEKYSNGSQAYKMQNLVSEFARGCSEEGLCRVDLLGYRYHGLSRPSMHGGQSSAKLDDISLLSESSTRVLAEHTFQVLGELFRNVPQTHKYRIYLLIITLLVCLGRRRTEVTLVPRQKLEKTPTGYFFYCLKLKAAEGSQAYTLTRVPLMTEVVPLMEAVLEELEECSSDLYAGAEEMCRNHGPDLRFLAGIEDDECLTYTRLLEMGLPTSVFNTGGWFDSNGLIQRALISSARVGVKRNGYVYKADVARYCWTHYHPLMTEKIYTASGRDYFVKDMLLLKYTGTSSGHYARWIVETCSSTMFDKFLPKLEELSLEYGSSRLSEKFTSHDFRHTMNDALDKGGLPELMQTEFFGRKNPRDNKAYQHTSPQRRALDIREKIKLGEVGGAIAERVMRMPQSKQDAYLATKVTAVHDLGNGLCFRRWMDGPCDRHLQCHTGCNSLGWLKEPEDKQASYDEIMRLVAHHLFSLEIAAGVYSDRKGLTISSWEKHYCLIIGNLLKRADELVSGTSLKDVYNYVNTGGLDAAAARVHKDKLGQGYQWYVQCRQDFHQQCLDYELEFSKLFETPRAAVPFVEVK